MRMSIDKQPTTKEPHMAKPKQPTALSPDEIELLLESIALDHLFIDTLQTRHRAGRERLGCQKRPASRV